MSLKSKIVSLLLIVFIAGFLMAGGSSDSGAGKKVIMRVADVWSPAHPNSDSIINVFKPRIEQKTNGAISVEIYSSGALGSEQTLWDSVRNGSIEVGILGALLSTEYSPLLISDWPFLYRDLEHASKVWTGPFADDFFRDFNRTYSTTMKLLAVGPNSARTFTSNKPLTSVADFRGQKFRMPGTRIHPSIVADLGASAQVIPLTDLFNALQTGVVDGQDNGMVTVLSEKFYEVQKFLYETSHIVAIMTTVVNVPFFNSLSAEQQQIVQDAAKEASLSAWTTYIKSVDADRQKLRDFGVTVTSMTAAERDRFIQAIQPTLNMLYAENDWAKSLIEKVGNVR